MSLLVLAPDLLQLFAGWELVGTTSYLLIGFWYQKPSAARAATKAFWIVKLADAAFLAALALLLVGTGSLAYTGTLPPGLVEAVPALLLVGVLGKSAQMPLHVWLPDAMAGPTPVSALLHAATMVAAGVFLVVRADALFAQAAVVRQVMAYGGAITALSAAILALTQTDLKRVLAYSTCSQLGFMLAGLGAGELLGGYFHLGTHAAFKALLFLAAGSVIHAVGGNELSRMGGLAKKMPLTAAVFVIGGLALAGFPGLAGFFSKDLILEGVAGAGMPLVLVLLLGASLVTALYVGRVLVVVLFGKPGPDADHAHVHEAPPSMAVPLLALALPAALAGLAGGPFASLLGLSHSFHLGTAGVIATGLGLAGLTGGWLLFRRGRRQLRPVAARPFDRAFELAYARGLVVVGAIAAWLDRYVIDGLMNAVGALGVGAGKRLRAIQTGNVQDYLLAVCAGVAALVAWGMFR
jgi:proton-translocating NADH-quinone oxidoreductase chain L